MHFLRGLMNRRAPITVVSEEPSLESPVWQMCTASQLEGQAYEAATQALYLPRGLKHRKYWEWAYIRTALMKQFGSLEGKRGLGFGVGREVLAANFAGSGAIIVATDLSGENAASAEWIESDQHASSLDTLRYPDHCPDALFNKRVSYRAVDMNAIPDDLRGFDFVWSSCSLEHLGSLKHGLDFIQNAMRCLRPGGVAVHTTEFNVGSNDETLETPSLSLYRRQDIEKLADALRKAGHQVPALNFCPGTSPLDKHIDLPPYSRDKHLKLRVSEYDTTSFGMIIKAGHRRRR